MRKWLQSHRFLETTESVTDQLQTQQLQGRQGPQSTLSWLEDERGRGGCAAGGAGGGPGGPGMPGSAPTTVPEGNQSQALTQLPAGGGGRCFGRIPVEDAGADAATGAEGADPFPVGSRGSGGSGGRMDPRLGPWADAFAPSGFLPCLPSPLHISPFALPSPLIT